MTTDKMQLVKFENFTGGESGRLGKSKSPDGLFHAQNMMVYSNGLLGPRPGFRNATPLSVPNGKVRMIGTIPVAGTGGIMIIGRTVYHWDLYNPSSTLTAFPTQLASVAGNSKPIPHKTFTDVIYITVPGDKTYKITSTDVVPITGSPGGVAIEVYGERMLIAEAQDSRRIFYNDPNTGGPFETWTGQFFDVGDRWQVSAIREQRQGVTIYKGRSIWMLTGVPGVNSVLRPISHAEPPIHPWHEAMDENDVSWFIPVFRSNVASYAGSTPEQVTNLQDLEGPQDVSPNPDLPLNRGLTVSKGDITPSSVMAVQNLDGEAVFLLQHNGIWTRHTTEKDLSGMMFSSGRVITMTDGGADAAPATIWHVDFAKVRPSFATDQFGRPGDDSNNALDAFVYFPQWWSTDSKDVRVRSVVVDFVKWDTGHDDTTNHFGIDIISLGAEENDGSHLIQDEWNDDPAIADDTDDGTVARWIPRLGEEVLYGGGFQLGLWGIRGVAFKSITVELEVNTDIIRT